MKSFETKEKCQKEANKLIIEKTKKGYKEMLAGEVMPERIDVPKNPNDFEFTKKQKSILKEFVGNEEITKRQAQLIEKFCKKHAVLCYELIAIKGKPTPLDSSIGGIPYCPVGEELPKDKNGNEIPLLLQINFSGIDLLGYPNKGIFQLFLEDLESNNYDFDRIVSKGSRVRYYENTTADYRSDISYSNHSIVCLYEEFYKNMPVHTPGYENSFKIKLEKSWSMYPLAYSDYLEDDVWLFENCEIYNQMSEEIDEDTLSNVFSELFPNKSNIGGYGFTPQGQRCLPYSVEKDKKEAAILFLADDIISWGDGGSIYFFYEDMTKIKKDKSLWGYGDFS